MSDNTLIANVIIPTLTAIIAGLFSFFATSKKYKKDIALMKMRWKNCMSCTKTTWKDMSCKLNTSANLVKVKAAQNL